LQRRVPSRRWRKLWGRLLIKLSISTATILAAFLICAGCAKHSADEESAAAPTPEVTVAKVMRAAVTQDLIVSGNLAALPNRDSKVSALVPGRIARVLVIEGDRVKEGQVVAEIDSSLLVEQARQAEAAVAQAKANLENSRVAADREEGLLSRGISSRKEVEDARTQLAVNTAALHQAEAGFAAAHAQVARASVRSPLAGTVVKRFVAAGEQVDGTAAQPIVEVAQIDTLELIGTVPASRLAEIRTGESFSLETNVLPDSKLTARVVSILPAVDPATNNGTVRIRVDNPKQQLKLGEYLSVSLPLKQSGLRLVVPKQAVYPDESGEPHVYKVNGDEAESVAVKVGVQSGDRAEILEGVEEGTTVVVTGGYGLPEKSKVRVKP
jgi:RND family efflux transporter MFP subunit